MKKLITTFSILFAIPFSSQIAIGKSAVTAGSNVSLEFYDATDNVKGIGIGLLKAKKAAELINAQIVLAQSNDFGTTFQLVINTSNKKDEN